MSKWKNIPTDLEGRQIGYLKVIKFLYRNERSDQIWECYCNACEKTVKMGRHSLLSGHTKSCGCQSGGPGIKENVKRTNTYDLSGEYGIGYTAKGECFYFDLEDYDKIKDYSWYVSSAGGRNHHKRISAHIPGNKQCRNIKMHRLVMGAYDNNEYKGLDIDHINHNTFDNRKSNLRFATRSQNNTNRKVCPHSSPKTGVTWNSKVQRWEASIKVNKRSKYLGRYMNLEDAIQAREKAEKEYYGEFAYNKELVESSQVIIK